MISKHNIINYKSATVKNRRKTYGSISLTVDKSSLLASAFRFALSIALLWSCPRECIEINNCKFKWNVLIGQNSSKLAAEYYFWAFLSSKDHYFLPARRCMKTMVCAYLLCWKRNWIQMMLPVLNTEEQTHRVRCHPKKTLSVRNLSWWRCSWNCLFYTKS